jgi:putative addiction module killer protein
MNYIVQQTELFEKWHKNLKDLRAKLAIARRIDRACAGNLGDVKSLGNGISEMRVDVGAGYRVYYTIRHQMVIILLAGGNKSTQQADIKQAIDLIKEI